MSKQIEALKLALEALEVATTPLAKDRQEVLRAQAAIREALAEPPCKTGSQCTSKCPQCEQTAQQEPVAYSYTSRITGAQGFSHHPMPRFIDSESWDIKPLYTSPQPAQPSKPLPEDYTALEQALTRLQKRYADLEGKASKPLTDAQIGAVAADIWGSVLIAPQSYQAFARAIEAAHGIKEDKK